MLRRGKAPAAQRRLERLVLAGDHVRLQRGVSAAMGSLATPRRRLLAAQLTVGGRVRLTAAASLYCHELMDEPPDVVDLLVPSDRHVTAPRGARVRTTTRFAQAGRCGTGALRMAGVPWSLMDLCRDVDDMTATLVFVAAIRQRRTTLSKIQAAADARGRFPGVSRLRRVMAGLRGELNHSARERVLRSACRGAGLRPSSRPEPILLGGVFIAEGDIVFREARVIVEVDGPHHLLAAQQRADRERDRKLARSGGWLVLRYLVWEVDQDADRIAREIAEVVHARTPGA